MTFELAVMQFSYGAHTVAAVLAHTSPVQASTVAFTVICKRKQACGAEELHDLLVHLHLCVMLDQRCRASLDSRSSPGSGTCC